MPVVALAITLLLVSEAPGPPSRAHPSTAQRIVDQERTGSRVMDYLAHLANDIGPRPAGSKSHHDAAEWALHVFGGLGLSNVHLEEAGRVSARPDADWTRGLRATRPGEPTEHDDTGDTLVPVYNVVADIPGTDRPDEYVIIGAHFDSAPVGTGALDNGTGVAAVMEAARLLLESGARPKRTIRCILFAAEESQHLGSKAYVEAHRALMKKISAVYIMDRGTDYISAITATQPLKADMEAVFAPVVRLDPRMPFEVCLVDYLPRGDPDCAAGSRWKHGELAAVPEKTIRWDPDGSVTVTAEGYENLRLASDGSIESGDSLAKEVVASGVEDDGAVDGTGVAARKPTSEVAEEAHATGAGEGKKFVIEGGSDHLAFLEQGVPAFWWIQEGDGTVAYPAHTTGDTYDKAIPQFLEHSAVVIALGALGTADLDRMLSRERLADPGTE